MQRETRCVPQPQLQSDARGQNVTETGQGKAKSLKDELLLMEHLAAVIIPCHEAVWWPRAIRGI